MQNKRTSIEWFLFKYVRSIISKSILIIKVSMHLQIIRILILFFSLNIYLLGTNRTDNYVSADVAFLHPSSEKGIHNYLKKKSHRNILWAFETHGFDTQCDFIEVFVEKTRARFITKLWRQCPTLSQVRDAKD